jgi:hypothetical protein
MGIRYLVTRGSECVAATVARLMPGCEWSLDCYYEGRETDSSGRRIVGTVTAHLHSGPRFCVVESA